MVSGTRAILPVITAAAAIVLAGCGTAHAPAAGGAPATTTSTTAAARQPPKQRAEADAAAILASFAVPPGATKLSAAPSAGGSALSQPVSVPGDPDLVDDASWWQAPGQPQQLLAWEQAHLSHRFSAAGSSSGWNGHDFSYGDQFSLPAITGVLYSRELAVEAVAAGAGQTDLRVDSQVTWIPARAAGAVVPSATGAVTLSLRPNVNLRTPLPGPVTITNPDKVRKLAALVDRLPLFPPGAYQCPPAVGNALVLTFRARPGGPALAVATAELSGCGEIDLAIGAKQQPELGGPDDGRAVAVQALRIAGLPWQLPSSGL
jgi:hypothetical protein